jgi:hypothetical protein
MIGGAGLFGGRGAAQRPLGQPFRPVPRGRTPAPVSTGRRTGFGGLPPALLWQILMGGFR